MSQSLLLLAASIYGLLAMGLGAWGAHGLAGYLAGRGGEAADLVRDLASFETAVRYQFIHALGLLGLAAWGDRLNAPLRLSGGLWAAGILFFSGAIYLRVLVGINASAVLAPMGGLLLMFGWLMLGLSVFWPARKNA